nr:hypothetical protein [Mesorhizobium sp. L-8-3]
MNIVFIAACDRRVSMQIAARPAVCKPPGSQAVNGQASIPIRSNGRTAR